MSLSCTVATTRDDESLRPRVIPVLHNTLGLRAKPVLLIFSPSGPQTQDQVEILSITA